MRLVRRSDASERGRLARCSACGAATTYPVPDDAELERAYTGWYRPDSGASRREAMSSSARRGRCSPAALTGLRRPAPSWMSERVLDR